MHADNGNGVWSYQLRVKNTGSTAVTLPAYELNVKSAEGYSFPVTATALSSLTLKPLEEKLIEPERQCSAGAGSEFAGACE